MHNKHSLPVRAGFAFGLLLMAGASARADLISWSYNWEPSAAKIVADGGGTGYIGVTDEPSKAATGSSNTVITNLRSFSTASDSSPDTFNHAAYSFTLQLADTASKATGSLTFSGFFHGTLAANSANIKNTFTSATSQEVTLGGNMYTVTLGNYSPPGPPGASNAGSLNALVTVVPGGNGHISSTPEPSTLLLASLAVPCAGLTGWRKRRKSTATRLSAM